MTLSKTFRAEELHHKGLGASLDSHSTYLPSGIGYQKLFSCGFSHEENKNMTVHYEDSEIRYNARSGLRGTIYSLSNEPYPNGVLME